MNNILKLAGKFFRHMTSTIIYIWYTFCIKHITARHIHKTEELSSSTENGPWPLYKYCKVLCMKSIQGKSCTRNLCKSKGSDYLSSTIQHLRQVFINLSAGRTLRVTARTPIGKLSKQQPITTSTAFIKLDSHLKSLTCSGVQTDIQQHQCALLQEVS
jgi:hypothetical protein